MLFCIIIFYHILTMVTSAGF